LRFKQFFVAYSPGKEVVRFAGNQGLMVMVHVFRFLAKIAKPAKNANFQKKIPGGEPAAARAACAPRPIRF
jgi:hypothetical protein